MPDAAQAEPNFAYSNMPEQNQINQSPASNFQNSYQPNTQQNMQANNTNGFEPYANPFPPVAPVGNENMNGNMPQSMPVPPFEAPNNVKRGKGGKKALKIVLLSIISIVIVAGISIAVYSACTYNKSIMSIFTNDNYVSYTSEDEYYEDESFYDYFVDTQTHHKGDTVELINNTLTLTDYKIGEFEKGYIFSDKTKLDVTFELTNNTDSDYKLLIYQFSAYNADETYAYEEYSEEYDCEIVAVDGSFNNTELTIAPGETRKFTISFAVDKIIDIVEIFYDDNYTYDNEYTGNPEHKYTACNYQIKF